MIKKLLSPKVHVAINDRRSLCGMSPLHGNYDIRNTSTFLQAQAVERCGRCVEHLTRRGYAIEKLTGVNV